MANDITNYIKFNDKSLEKAIGEGRISTLDRDLDIKAVPFTSTNENAPTHQIFAKSPAGHNVQVGGIWKKISADNKPYFTVSVKPIGLNANLGRFAGQDDTTLQAIIAWEPQQS